MNARNRLNYHPTFFVAGIPKTSSITSRSLILCHSSTDNSFIQCLVPSPGQGVAQTLYIYLYLIFFATGPLILIPDCPIGGYCIVRHGLSRFIPAGGRMRFLLTGFGATAHTLRNQIGLGYPRRPLQARRHRSPALRSSLDH